MIYIFSLCFRLEKSMCYIGVKIIYDFYFLICLLFFLSNILLYKVNNPQ